MNISEIMGLVFVFILCIGGIFPLLIGLLTIYHWAKPAKPPADESNRINRVSSWWIGLTRPEVLAESWAYYRGDVLDNMKSVEVSRVVVGGSGYQPTKKGAVKQPPKKP